jgi:HEAT repeat protein
MRLDCGFWISDSGSGILDLRSGVLDLRSEVLDLRSEVLDLRSEVLDLKSHTANRNARARRPAVLVVAALVVCLALRATSAGSDQPRPVKTAEPSTGKDNVKPVAKGDPAMPLSWLPSLEEGHRRALAERKPVLVRVGAAWCQVCRRLAAEIEKPSVQEELARWVPVYLDADKAEDESRELNVTAVPALRIRTATGEVVASQDGAFTAEELVTWLKKHYEKATAEADEALFAAGRPDAAAVTRLVEQFGKRNAAVRETAVRRLAPWPAQARVAVTGVFAQGNLAARLSALELLRQWRAPVDELDPWRPETFTAERTGALAKWARQAMQPSPPRNPSAEDMAVARRDMDRMLRANSTEAEAIGHRLAALGAALLPEVTARIRAATGDQDRQRLWMLRYRLVADDVLPLRWPGGLARLAVADARQRQQAAEELVKLATPAERALLVELFSDPDPLVREISLRGLQGIGGKEATAALVKLLADPEPNVRAAVLKQLEEKPAPSMVHEVAEYLKRERDADLVVHGIRFLRAAGGTEAVRSMMALLHHESWQVRAEAAEAVVKVDEFRASSPSGGTGLQADVYVALLALLDDPEPFVISRALEGLAQADMTVAIEPLAAAAAKHPEMAAKILPLLAQGKMRAKGLPHLRKFAKHDNPLVRAAALWGLYSAVPEGMEQELAAGLRDPGSQVRIAAASVLFAYLGRQRQVAAERNLKRRDSDVDPFEPALVSDFEAPPPESTLTRTIRVLSGGREPPPKIVPRDEAPSEKPAAASPAEKPTAKAEVSSKEKPGPSSEDPWDRWLREYYAGKRRPKWTSDLAAPLEAMLRGSEPEERLRAALALTPLGRARSALPVLQDAVRTHRELYRPALEVLPWLVWEDRLRLFEQLRDLAPEAGGLTRLVEVMSEVPDRRAAAPLWEMLAAPKVTIEQAAALHSGLLAAYSGSPHRPSRRALPTPQSPGGSSGDQDVIKTVKAKAVVGGDLQRLVALAVLASLDPIAAAETARRVEADSRLDADLRRDAFQVVLAMDGEKPATQTAIAALGGADAPRRKLALAYLVHGREPLELLRDSLSLPVQSAALARSSGQPIVVKPPAGLEVRHVRPLLADSDPRIAAQAGYLLALLGNAEGLDALLRQVRQEKKDDWDRQRLVVRAVAALDDSTRIPLLREIYKGLDRQEITEFYWTVRVMTGEEILKFRKQIRDTVGMSNLR